ncbi:aldose 1-epimerase [Flagellimonas myxillae]|uniref:aldose epimerase family protein n=1 Tax=Flagellimonas myxillae TaxID=2942214 RepID=UPI00201E860E|nr:aldose 1-epimerase [Muricauda myxillae]MCL6265032.1 aldose 1-epimerase [Muricauda myxillae]
MTYLHFENSSVAIDLGELVSFIHGDHEFIHQKGSPGWGSSDTEMFPIIGPVNEAGFRVQVGKGNAIQDQHGHLRQMQYKLVSSTTSSATYRKEYKAGTAVKNSKFPEKSTEEWLTWPYSFQFEKSFNLTANQLEITFKISGEKDMPFMLGYHPAFKLYLENPIIVAGELEISLNQVLEVGSRALSVENCESITLKDKKEISLTTEGFGNFMCWTEVPNMVCIEPISFYPYTVAQDQLHQGFHLLTEEPQVFKVTLKV